MCGKVACPPHQVHRSDVAHSQRFPGRSSNDLQNVFMHEWEEGSEEPRERREGREGEGGHCLRWDGGVRGGTGVGGGQEGREE